MRTIVSRPATRSRDETAAAVILGGVGGAPSGSSCRASRTDRAERLIFAGLPRPRGQPPRRRDLHEREIRERTLGGVEQSLGPSRIAAASA